MSNMLGADLQEYAADLFAPIDDEMLALTRAALDFGMPAGWEISPDVGRLFQLLCKAIGARKVLEFGTLAGHSALYFARALPQDGEVISVEMNAEYARFAVEHLAAFAHGHKVDVRVGAAMEMLEVLVRDGLFDVIFLDADKAHYPEMLAWSKRVLRPGGILLADNVLQSSSWNGQGLLDADADDPRIHGIRAFNKQLAADSDFTALIIPMRAGVAAAVYSPVVSAP